MFNYKSLMLTALTLTLSSFSVLSITTQVQAKPSISETILEKGKKPTPPPPSICTHKPWVCPILGSGGNTSGSPRGNSGNIRPDLNNLTNADAIKTLEEWIASEQATEDDYMLLGYFYGLEKKYDQSEINYLKALKLTTDEKKQAIIEQELKKLRAVMLQPKLGVGVETKL